MSPLLETPLARILLLGGLVLALQVPAAMIGSLRAAREQARDDAATEVAAHWGARQEVLGPLLVVPCRTATAEGWQLHADGPLVLAPEELQVDAATKAEQRRRGLFEIPVFRAQLRLSGRFNPPSQLPGCATPQWDAAQLVLRISDVHALDDVAPLRWGGTTRMFEPGSGMLGGAGVHAPLTSVAAHEPASFEATLTLRGSGGLFFAPVGLDSSATLRSDWPDPSFLGAWLPATREVTGEGFTARWRIPHVARGLPAAWKPGAFHDDELKSALFGANFIAPVDPYRMTERSLKYSALIVGLTFVLLWLFEVAGGARVHPVQYLMLGAALCLFYLLELSLAEHFGFTLAYLLASGAVTAQVTLYARSALDGARPLVLCLGVVALYGLLYVLLREDDYALLAGSATLFVLLSAVMFLTRRVRWDRSGEAPSVQ